MEQHLEDAPASYIQWRFKHGYDEEKIGSEAFKITPEEQQAIDDFGLEAIWSRRMRAGQLEYEVKKKNVPERDNKYYTKNELLAMGFKQLLKQTDEKIAAKEAGLDIRPVTISEIQKHLVSFCTWSQMLISDRILSNIGCYPRNRMILVCLKSSVPMERFVV